MINEEFKAQRNKIPSVAEFWDLLQGARTQRYESSHMHMQFQLSVQPRFTIFHIRHFLIQKCCDSRNAQLYTVTAYDIDICALKSLLVTPSNIFLSSTKLSLLKQKEVINLYQMCLQFLIHSSKSTHTVDFVNDIPV